MIIETMAVSTNWGVQVVVGVLIVRALLFVFYLGSADFWKPPDEASPESKNVGSLFKACLQDEKQPSTGLMVHIPYWDYSRAYGPYNLLLGLQ